MYLEAVLRTAQDVSLKTDKDGFVTITISNRGMYIRIPKIEYYGVQNEKDEQYHGKFRFDLNFRHLTMCIFDHRGAVLFLKGNGISYIIEKLSRSKATKIILSEFSNSVLARDYVETEFLPSVFIIKGPETSLTDSGGYDEDGGTKKSGGFGVYILSNFCITVRINAEYVTLTTKTIYLMSDTGDIVSARLQNSPDILKRLKHSDRLRSWTNILSCETPTFSLLKKKQVELVQRSKSSIERKEANMENEKHEVTLKDGTVVIIACGNSIDTAKEALKAMTGELTHKLTDASFARKAPLSLRIRPSVHSIVKFISRKGKAEREHLCEMGAPYGTTYSSMRGLRILNDFIQVYIANDGRVFTLYDLSEMELSDFEKIFSINLYGSAKRKIDELVKSHQPLLYFCNLLLDRKTGKLYYYDTDVLY